LKSVTGTRILGHGRRKDLDRDISVQLWLVRAIHLTEGSPTNQGFDLERAVLENGSAL
jgi:hypothetical protein